MIPVSPWGPHAWRPAPERWLVMDSPSAVDRLIGETGPSVGVSIYPLAGVQVVLDELSVRQTGVEFLAINVHAGEELRLGGLHSLRHVALPLGGVPQPDLPELPRLEHVKCPGTPDWIDLVDRCASLRSLHLDRTRKSTCMGPSLASRLHSLWLTGGSFSGIPASGPLGALRAASVVRSPSLESIALLSESADVEWLEVVGCRRLIDLEKVVRALKCVRVLKFERLPRLKSLEFLLDLPRLEYVAFVGVPLESNDLSPLLEIPSLKSCGFDDRPDYTHSHAEVKAELKSRWR